jgi:hypothetical protein
MPIDTNRLTPIGRSRTQPGVIHASVEIPVSGGLIGYLLWVLRPAEWWRETHDSVMRINNTLIKQEMTRAYNTTKKIKVCLELLRNENKLDKKQRDAIVISLADENALWHALSVYMPFLKSHLLLEELEELREKSPHMREGHYLDLANMLRDTQEGIKSWNMIEKLGEVDETAAFMVNEERYEEYLRMSATISKPIRV